MPTPIKGLIIALTLLALASAAMLPQYWESHHSSSPTELPIVSGTDSQIVPAHFENGTTTFTYTFDAGPAGGIFRVPVQGTPVDGVSVQIPPTAVGQTIRVSIGYSTGSLKLNEGVPSGVVIVMKMTPAVTLQRSIAISISFPPNPHHKLLVGYEIAADGRLRPLDLLSMDMKEGLASFSTFHSLSMTWVYIE
jgi:hypothetical protein